MLAQAGGNQALHIGPLSQAQVFGLTQSPAILKAEGVAGAIAEKLSLTGGDTQGQPAEGGPINKVVAIKYGIIPINEYAGTFNTIESTSKFNDIILIITVDGGGRKRLFFSRKVNDNLEFRTENGKEYYAFGVRSLNHAGRLRVLGGTDNGGKGKYKSKETVEATINLLKVLPKRP